VMVVVKAGSLSFSLSAMPYLCLSPSLSLFSVALTDDGRDWVTAAQSEMGGTSGTRRQRSVMVVMKGALYVHAFEIWLLGRNLVFWFYFLNLFMLKCHIFIGGQTRGFFAISGRKLSSKGKY
jgi:hypothetical protein